MTTATTAKAAHVLYLAYGSNLCKANMRRRCPTARAVGKVMLQDARLTFRGVADLEYAPGFKVPCGVWRLYPQDVRSLDQYEGVAGGYYRKEWLELANGKLALVYVMNSEGIFPPTAQYVDALRRGYADFGFDATYIDEAIERSYDHKDPTDWERHRRSRQRANNLKLVKMPEAVALRRLAAQQEEDNGNGR